MKHLADAKLAGQSHHPISGGWARFIIEKPFGHNLSSARALNVGIVNDFNENDIYRIDHFLGKEIVQNLFALRFANSVFEPVWNRNYIDHIQITAAETLGVEGRGGFYESACAIRDMVQNHLLQLCALVAIEPPSEWNPRAERDEKVKVLRAVRRIHTGEVSLNAVRGQYASGNVDGKHVSAYRKEPKVATDSQTETYAALKLYIDNMRWAGVPFYLRSGKHLAKRETQIVVEFKPDPHTNRSDCHAWGAHPLYHYYASVLGIRPAAPGFASVNIRPQLGGLDWVHGALVHPGGGMVDVEVNRQTDGLHGLVCLHSSLEGELQVNGGVVLLKPGETRF